MFCACVEYRGVIMPLEKTGTCGVNNARTEVNIFMHSDDKITIFDPNCKHRTGFNYFRAPRPVAAILFFKTLAIVIPY